MVRLPRYVSPMPRHRRAPYAQWKLSIEGMLAKERPSELARLLNSAALLFAEHHQNQRARECLLAQLALADDATLKAGGDLDAFVNLVRLSMITRPGTNEVMIFWLKVLEGTDCRGASDWLPRRAAQWREAVIDTLIQEALRKQGVDNRSRLLELAASPVTGLPESSMTLRQEYLERTGESARIGARTQTFTRVVGPLSEGDRNAHQAAQCVARACEGLRELADHIDGSWWRAVAATVAGLPVVPVWLDDQVAAFLRSEPLLANALPLPLVGRYVLPAQLRNTRLSSLDLDELAGSIAAKLATYADLPDQIRRYVQIYSHDVREAMSSNAMRGQTP